MDMKLSIIVPIYNVEKYLAECVDSLLSQTLGDFEVILVDDGSSDGSGAIADRYAREYPEQVRCVHVENGGQGRARNLAIELARGDYIGFIDSDDWIDPDMYRKLYDAAELEGKKIAVCDWLAVFPDGKETVLPARYSENLMAFAGSACNKIFLRSLIGEIRFPEKMWYEDFYFSAMLLMKAGDAAYVREPLYKYRQSPSSTMRNNNARKNLDILSVMDMLEGYMRMHGHQDDFDYLVLNHVLLDAINRVTRQSAADRDEVIKVLRDYAREKIPDLRHCRMYRKESRNRRLLMLLNYRGLQELSRFALDVRHRLSKGEGAG